MTKEYSKRIAILIPTLGSGGAEKQALLLAELICQSHIVFLFYSNEESISAFAQTVLKRSVAIHKIKVTSFNFHHFSEICRLLKENKIEIMFNFLTSCDFYGSLAGKKADVKKIYNGIRSTYLPIYKVILELFSHTFLANGTVFNSVSASRKFERLGFCKRKNIVIHNCIESVLMPIVREDKRIKNIVSIGRFVRDKDYETSLRCVYELKKVRKDFHYFIAGYGVLQDQIIKFIQDYNLENVVTIIPPPHDVIKILSDSDIYLSTSLFEGTSNSILEAMNSSLPIVATNVGDNSLLFDPPNGGYICSIKAVKEIVIYLNYLLDSHKERVLCGLFNNKQIANRFSKEKFVDNYQSLIFD